MRILCLHGSHQNSGLFRERLAKLETHFKNVATFVFLDGPTALPLEQGQDLPLRTWWAVSEDEPDAQEWASILEVITGVEPCDVVLGFSQGAALVARLCFEGTIPATVRGAILAGCPAVVPASKSSRELHIIPSLHFAGTDDALVPVSDSKVFADAMDVDGVRCEFVVHPGGHVLPQRAEDLSSLMAFLQSVASEAVADGVVLTTNAQLDEECQILSNVFDPSECTIRFAPYPPTVELALHDDDAHTLSRMQMTFLPGYPDVIPRVQFHSVPQSVQCSEAYYLFQQSIEDLCRARAGDAMLFEVVSHAKEGYLGVLEAVATAAAQQTIASASSQASTSATKFVIDPEEDDATRKANMDAAFAYASTCRIETHHQHEQQASGSSWTEYVVGLVGKPSAGKSTLFNAITNPNTEGGATGAKVAAHPFTTIEPNFGAGYVGLPCACATYGKEQACGAKFGHTLPGVRRVPVRMKDVAGLVPGAYQGRGKGNKFLDDLTDADVLIHVVDVSGYTNSEGEEAGAHSGDPVEEIRWVRDEIHNWIFDNLIDKWASVVKHPETRLQQMFSGYQVRHSLILDVLRALGLSLKEFAAQVSHWKRADVHRLVAVFLRHRFPVMVALNKCDRDTASSNIDRVRAAYPHETVVPVCAMAHVDVLSGRALTSAQQSRLDACAVLCDRKTGVELALTTAVTLRPVLRVYPIQDTTTFEACKGDPSSVFYHCVLVRPGSRVYDVFRILVGEGVLDGDFVGAQIVGAPSQNNKIMTIKKEEMLSEATATLRIMTTKKSAWQKSKDRIVAH
eukprot:PhM_4_TR8417/c0_g3_i1/m.8156/K06942/ychF; ribosome-binding ATPase